jgi:large subunit ribosomal protein L6
MSRIGRKPVEIPKGVTVAVNGPVINGKSTQGDLSLRLPVGIQAKVADGRVEVSTVSDDPALGAFHGTARTLVANMVKGLQTPYVKELVIQGVGFKAAIQGQKLTLSLGYSHPINYELPAGIAVKVADGTSLTVSGPDKQLVGQVSARIRGYFPAEPYKGKGVRFKGEHIRRKAGKAVA